MRVSVGRRLWASLAQLFLRARGRRRAGPFEKGKHVASLLRQCRPRLCETSSSEIPLRSLLHIQAAGSRADKWAFIKGRSGGVSVRKVQTENTEECQATETTEPGGGEMHVVRVPMRSVEREDKRSSPQGRSWLNDDRTLALDRHNGKHVATLGLVLGLELLSRKREKKASQQGFSMYHNGMQRLTLGGASQTACAASGSRCGDRILSWPCQPNDPLARQHRQDHRQLQQQTAWPSSASHRWTCIPRREARCKGHPWEKQSRSGSAK